MQKIIKLISTNKNQFEDITVNCKVVDIKKYVKNELKTKQIKQAKKYFIVKAKQAEVGEKVFTRPIVERNGKEYYLDETKNIVKEKGSMIIINPMGEEYIVKPDDFVKKYKETDKENTYFAVGDAIDYIELTEDIVFIAPWGQEMIGLKGGVLNITNLNDIYSIQNTCFKNTYLKLEKQKNEDFSL